MTDSSSCIDCDGKRPVVARGLCGTCYSRSRRHGSLHQLPKRNHSFEEHLAMIVPDGDGCWPWPGFISVKGYGRVSSTPAHVKSYQHHVGPVPEGHDVGHVCHDQDPTCQDWRTCLHRRCVNPDHLRPQTRSENLRARPYRKAVCKRGHELTPQNVYLTPDGRRECATCKKAASSAFYYSRRDEINARRRALSVGKRGSVRP